MNKTGPVTRWIVIINCLVAAASLYFQFRNGRDGFNPVQQVLALRIDQFVGGAWWQIFSAMWVHAEFYGMGVLHIIFNMATLAGFGTAVEREIGARRYIVLYVLAGLAGNFFFMGEALTRWLAFGHGEMFHLPVIGASAAVCGVVAAFSILYPDARLYLMLIPVPVRAETAVRGLIVVSLLFLFTSSFDFVAHSAHIGGAVAGWCLMWFILKRCRPSPAPGDGGYDAGPPDLDEALKVSLMTDAEVLSEIEQVLNKAAAGGMLNLSGRERKILERGRGLLR